MEWIGFAGLIGAAHDQQLVADSAEASGVKWATVYAVLG